MNTTAKANAGSIVDNETPLIMLPVVFAFKITTNYHILIMWNVYEKNCFAERKGVITTEQAAAGQEAWLFCCCLLLA